MWIVLSIMFLFYTDVYSILQIRNICQGGPFQSGVKAHGGEVFKPDLLWRAFVKRTTGSARVGEFLGRSRLMLDQRGFWMLAERMQACPRTVQDMMQQTQWMIQLQPTRQAIANLNNLEEWSKFGVPVWSK